MVFWSVLGVQPWWFLSGLKVRRDWRFWPTPKSRMDLGSELAWLVGLDLGRLRTKTVVPKKLTVKTFGIPTGCLFPKFWDGKVILLIVLKLFWVFTALPGLLPHSTARLKASGAVALLRPPALARQEVGWGCFLRPRVGCFIGTPVYFQTAPLCNPSHRVSFSVGIRLFSFRGPHNLQCVSNPFMVACCRDRYVGWDVCMRSVHWGRVHPFRVIQIFFERVWWIFSLFHTSLGFACEDIHICSVQTLFISQLLEGWGVVFATLWLGGLIGASVLYFGASIFTQDPKVIAGAKIGVLPFIMSLGVWVA